MGGTVAALKILMPNAVAIVVRADIIVRQHANELRFLIRENAFKRYTLRVATAGNFGQAASASPQRSFFHRRHSKLTPQSVHPGCSSICSEDVSLLQPA